MLCECQGVMTDKSLGTRLLYDSTLVKCCGGKSVNGSNEIYAWVSGLVCPVFVGKFGVFKNERATLCTRHSVAPRGKGRVRGNDLVFRGEGDDRVARGPRPGTREPIVEFGAIFDA